tara:strand:+ start:781 stop:882 length:102 start_codon:yes stop_codon:yes gene_type:complete
MKKIKKNEIRKIKTRKRKMQNIKNKLKKKFFNE